MSNNLIIISDKGLKTLDLKELDWKLLFNLDSVVTKYDWEDLLEQLKMFVENLEDDGKTT